MDSTDLSTVSYTTTPLRSDGNIGNTSRRQNCERSSSNQYKTPVRCNEIIMKRGKPNSFRSGSFKNMPIYSPPTDSTGNVKNPFEHARFLKERLSQPICSPSLFEKKMSPAEESDEQFTWSIEDISVLNPAPINENPTQEFDSWFSPATESEAQQAINKFFSSQVVNMDSPIEVRQIKCKNDASLETENTTAESWSQTSITFPPDLPPEIEQVLSGFCTFFDNDVDEGEDFDSSDCSIRRKRLSFDSVVDDEESSLSNTPPQINNRCTKQTIASTPKTSTLSSPELSPIGMNEIQDSPMDVSVSFRTKTRLSTINDVHINDKENVQQMSWNYISNVSTAQSSDSAFSSV